MNHIRIPLIVTLSSVALLAACSADTTEDPTSATAASEAPAASARPEQGPSGDQQMSARGVTGEVAYVAEGVAQVQDGSTQTAVRFGSDTTFTKQVALALADVETGACVMAVLGDDDAATSLTVSDPVDGECSVGFPGGAGGFPGGEGGFPDGAGGRADAEGSGASEGELSALPSGAPSFEPGEGMGEFPGGFGGFVVGTVAAVGSDSLTVTGSDGTVTELSVSAETTISGTAEATSDDVAVGLCMTAVGDADDAGGYDARIVQLSEAGEQGCVTRGFGGMSGMPDGMGGMPGGQASGPNDQQGDD